MTAKRAFDLAVAAVALVVCAPLLLALALLVKLDSPGPAFFCGPRVGKDGRLFRLYKLRTMVEGAEHQGPPLTAEDDPRITRLGRSLRRRRLDELPQLVNVLKGEMSLVGPAPEDPGYVARYTPQQRRVLMVRPGVTGPARLAFSDEGRLLAAGRGDATYAESILPMKLDLDLAYVENPSFSNDLAMLGRAVSLFFPRHSVSFRRLVARRRVPWALLDGSVVAVAFGAALLLYRVDAPGAAGATASDHLRLGIAPLLVLYVAMNYAWGLHRRLWRFATVTEIRPILGSAATSTLAGALINRVAAVWHGELPLTLLLMGGFFAFCGFVALRYRARLLGIPRSWRLPGEKTRVRALIYGAGELGQVVAWRLLTCREGRAYQPVGFIDDDRAKLGLRVHGIEVLGNRSDLAGLVERERVELIIMAMNNVSGEKLRAIVSAAQQTSAQIKIARGSFDWAAAANGVPLVREVRVEDLLARPQASLDYAGCERTLGYKTVVVTGACGSIGSELCRKIASFSPRRLVAIDNNETGTYDLEIELRLKFPTLDLKVVVADVTNAPRMEALFREARPDVIFHVAAYKHVPLMEEYPEEAVRVNCLGTAIVLRNARRYRAERFVLVSTDKAVNPSSVMGATKRVAEMLVTSAAAEAQSSGQPSDRGLLCTTVRFGNVLASRGSVVPTFARQIELGGPVTVTHVDMTRYFMDISEAASLIIQAAVLTQGQDIFMLDMGERIRIDDLARKMIRMRGLRPEIDIPIQYTGMRAGEKLHEELAYADEEKEATDHPLIYRLKGERKPDTAVVQQALDRLLELAAVGAREQLVRELLQVSRSNRQGEGLPRSGHVPAVTVH